MRGCFLGICGYSSRSMGMLVVEVVVLKRNPMTCIRDGLWNVDSFHRA